MFFVIELKNLSDTKSWTLFFSGILEKTAVIYKTIKKVILYLFSTSWGEALTITGALLLGYPLPLLPAQIIWLNFVTDGFLDVALAMEPKEKVKAEAKAEKPAEEKKEAKAPE